jgi:putative NADH-flavin reductase
MAKAEEILISAKSNIDWTLLEPVGLFEGEKTSKIRYWVDQPSRDGFWLSLSDTAVATRKILATDAWIRKFVQPSL